MSAAQTRKRPPPDQHAILKVGYKVPGNHSLSGNIEATVKELLTAVANGQVRPEEAVEKINGLLSSKLVYSVVDEDRRRRTGVSEVVYGESKTVQQLLELVRHFSSRGDRLLITRVSESKALAVKEEFPEAEYNGSSRLFWVGSERRDEFVLEGKICVVCAGTSDIPVAEEAALTGEWLGAEVLRVWDVGVAGIHRLFERLDELREAQVIIVVAGMEGALASVVTGLVQAPVIAVPTSVGYGTNLGGLTTLLAMLSGCSAGATVVNIDNGFGAAMAAARILRCRL
jgi:NCAIR mutase (PurE)-related protein